MPTLFAVDLIFGPSAGLTGILGMLAGALILWMYQRSQGVTPPPVQATTGQSSIASAAQQIAFAANKEDLGAFQDVFMAIGNRDRQAFERAVDKLAIAISVRGSLANLLEEFTHGRVRKLLGDPQDRSELLQMMSSTLGQDVEAALAQAKANSATKASAIVASLLLGLALCLGLASPAAAFGPERFIPREVPVVHDAPVFAGSPASSQPISTLRPDGQVARPAYHRACGYQRAAFWHRGPIRRFFAAPFRAWGRWAPIRRLFGRC